MRGVFLLAMLALAPTEVAVKEGQTPALGSERAKAQIVLDTVRNAMKQTDSNAARRQEALAKLKEAESHFQNARYAEVDRTADELWKLLSAPAPTIISINVDKDGKTTVESHSGSHVRVDAQNETRQLQPGERVKVVKGQPPPAPLEEPKLSQPANKDRLKLRPTSGGLGPVTFSWQEVKGAERYEVELVDSKGEKKVLVADTNQLKLPVSAGSYVWSVRALTNNSRSRPSTEHGFEVSEHSVKLEVQPSNWK